MVNNSTPKIDEEVYMAITEVLINSYEEKGFHTYKSYVNYIKQGINSGVIHRIIVGYLDEIVKHLDNVFYLGEPNHFFVFTFFKNNMEDKYYLIMKSIIVLFGGYLITKI